MERVLARCLLPGATVLWDLARNPSAEQLLAFRMLSGTRSWSLLIGRRRNFHIIWGMRVQMNSVRPRWAERIFSFFNVNKHPVTVRTFYFLFFSQADSRSSFVFIHFKHPTNIFTSLFSFLQTVVSLSGFDEPTNLSACLSQDRRRRGEEASVQRLWLAPAGQEARRRAPPRESACV